jgi:hypothetical protein
MERFNYQNFAFDHDPYPVGVSPAFVEPGYYAQMVDRFPPIDLFDTFPDAGSHKKALAEMYNPAAYHRFVRQTPVYREFYEYVKSPRFVRDVLDCFEQNYVELRLGRAPVTSSTLPLRGGLFHLAERVLRRLRRRGGLRARFEFSALPSDGGSIRPHTDTPSKLITLVLAIARPGEWSPAWKGGTDILRPRDIRRNYNYFNRYLDFEECETLKTFEYVPNQCLLFLKTFNSLHAVAPIQKPGGREYRRTLTLNIESA